MTFGFEMAFRRSCGAHFQKSCPTPIDGPCKLLLWYQWRVQFSTFRKLPYKNVRAVAVKSTLFKNCSCYQLENSSCSSSAVRKVPVARLPCLLFGPPPPAAPVIGAQAPSRPWPPRSSVSQASGSSSLCCARSLLVISYTFEPGIASLHKENNTFFKQITIFDPISLPKPPLGLPLVVPIWTILAALPFKNAFKIQYFCPWNAEMCSW